MSTVDEVLYTLTNVCNQPSASETTEIKVDDLRILLQEVRRLRATKIDDPTHRCVACGHEYAPQEGESEDCPICGCDGTLPWPRPT